MKKRRRCAVAKICIRTSMWYLTRYPLGFPLVDTLGVKIATIHITRSTHIIIYISILINNNVSGNIINVVRKRRPQICSWLLIVVLYLSGRFVLF